MANYYLIEVETGHDPDYPGTNPGTNSLVHFTLYDEAGNQIGQEFLVNNNDQIDNFDSDAWNAGLFNPHLPDTGTLKRPIFLNLRIDNDNRWYPNTIKITSLDKVSIGRYWHLKDEHKKQRRSSWSNDPNLDHSTFIVRTELSKEHDHIDHTQVAEASFVVSGQIPDQGIVKQGIGSIMTNNSSNNSSSVSPETGVTITLQKSVTLTEGAGNAHTTALEVGIEAGYEPGAEGGAKVTVSTKFTQEWQQWKSNQNQNTLSSSVTHSVKVPSQKVDPNAILFVVCTQAYQVKLVQVSNGIGDPATFEIFESQNFPSTSTTPYSFDKSNAEALYAQLQNQVNALTGDKTVINSELSDLHETLTGLGWLQP